MLPLILALLAAPDRSITQTVTGPGTYFLAVDGQNVQDFAYAFTIRPVPADVTITKVEFSRFEDSWQPPFNTAFTLDYQAEWTRQTAATEFQHVWREKAWLTIAPFIGSEPDPSISLLAPFQDYGWTYVWPTAPPYVGPLGPYDGVTDFAGVSGYAGEINGVTAVSTWRTIDPSWHWLFQGTQPVTLYYCPRLTDSVRDGANWNLGHWGVDRTNCHSRIGRLSIRITGRR